MYRHVRWCFNVGKWSPSRDDWLKLTASISDEELVRINKFHYQDDSKSSIIGRALIRKFVSMALEAPSNEIDLDRTAHGRPIISERSLKKFSPKSVPTSLDFNVSHSGDYCILAGFWTRDPCEIRLTVGADVTRIVSKKTKQELDRFLDLMSRREFLPDEWRTVTGAADDRQKCVNFTRLWCLKESFIKSIGLGLSYGLNRICFRPCAANSLPDRRQLLSDTQVLVDNQLAPDWTFLETALDEEHLVAIGYNYDRAPRSPSQSAHWLDTGSSFEVLDIDHLLEGITPIRSPASGESNWIQFSSKASKQTNVVIK